MTATGLEQEPTALLVVAGAHLRGEPLHPSLLALGARFIRATRTAPEYRMVALPALDGSGGLPAVPPRPGLVRDPAGGGALEVEIYELPVAALGRLLLTEVGPGNQGPMGTCVGRLTGLEGSLRCLSLIHI